MARRCFGTKWSGEVPGHGVPEMVTPASRTTAILLVFLNLLASDKFKIIVTLRQAQKFGDIGPYTNFDLLLNRLLTAGFRNFS